MPVPQPSEMEHSPKKPMSSSEPILDLKTDVAEAAPAHSDPEEPQQSLDTRQDPPVGTSSTAEEPSPAPPMGTETPAEQKNPMPTECPARPNTLDFSKSLKRLEEVRQGGQRRSSEQGAGKEDGVDVGPAVVPALSEERRALQSELGKCIEDFRKIKIPVAFPNKKRQWQSELLKKYQL